MTGTDSSVIEERFRLAADAINGMIYDLDLLTGRAVRTRGLGELLGHDPGEVPEAEAWWYDQMHPEDRLRFRPVDASSTSTFLHNEYRVRHREGHWVHLDDRAVVVRDADGRPTRVVGCATDITARKTAEQRLREADRRKDEFLATLAHELRNPLSPMRNALTLLAVGLDDRPAEHSSALRILDRQLRQMVRLIDDLLDVSRISRGTIELRLEPLPVSRVVKYAVDTNASIASAKRQRVQLIERHQSLTVRADEARLSQVFDNLVSNACKFTPDDGIITILVEAEGPEVVVRVRDTGIGIPPHQMSQMFEMFTQGDRSLEKAAGGLGIGLSLVRALVALHGGTVTGRSEGLGKGSEFVVRLPLLQNADGVAPEPGVVVPAAPPERRRVLVVDDNPDAADSLASLLSVLGQEVRVARDGLEAVDAAVTFRPELVLLDIGMPRLNGYEACRVIRDTAGGRQIVMVALTGWGQAGDKQRSRNAGFDFHLTKPVDPTALERLIARHTALDRDDAARAAYAAR